MFGVVWVVDTLRASETRMDMAEGEFLGVASPSFLKNWLLVFRALSSGPGPIPAMINLRA